jgi:chromosomal replication initiation ATPase DnaA
MCKSEIFAEILRIVSRETEISTSDILSNNKEAVVVAARPCRSIYVRP